MLQQGLIQPSTSPWSFPVIVVKKKNGKFRFCVNYKPLNNITKKDNYSLPRIDEMLDALHIGKFFKVQNCAEMIKNCDCRSVQICDPAGKI
jgi:hypothetical protein